VVGAAVFFAFMVGLVAAGMLSSIWTIVTDDPPEMEFLTRSDILTPVRVVVLVFSAPTLLFSGAFHGAMQRSVLAVGYLGLGILWSIFQGVFILTSVFNLS
jgi:hypothetical protein